MKTLFCGGLVMAAVLTASHGWAQSNDLRLSIANGRVTLIAHNVSVRQILDEWARIGQARIINAEKVVGPPVTLELQDVPEGQALESLLRTAAGYIAAPRVSGEGPSVYDRIYILATSQPPAAVAPPPPAPFSRTVNPPAMPVPPVEDDDVGEPDDQGAVPQGVLPPGFQPMPGSPPPTPQQGPILTAPRPGMLPQPANPQQPVVRPPGGGPGGDNR